MRHHLVFELTVKTDIITDHEPVYTRIGTNHWACLLVANGVEFIGTSRGSVSDTVDAKSLQALALNDAAEQMRKAMQMATARENEAMDVVREIARIYIDPQSSELEWSNVMQRARELSQADGTSE